METPSNSKGAEPTVKKPTSNMENDSENSQIGLTNEKPIPKMDDTEEKVQLTNKERFYAWRTGQAVAAWHRRDLEECKLIALQLLGEPFLPLWHRCNLDFYLASVARLKGLPELGQTYLRESLHYIAVQKDIDVSKGKDPDPAYTELQVSVEHLMIELEADVLSSQDKASIALYKQRHQEMLDRANRIASDQAGKLDLLAIIEKAELEAAKIKTTEPSQPIPEKLDLRAIIKAADLEAAKIKATEASQPIPPIVPGGSMATIKDEIMRMSPDQLSEISKFTLDRMGRDELSEISQFIDRRLSGDTDGSGTEGSR